MYNTSKSLSGERYTSFKVAKFKILLTVRKFIIKCGYLPLPVKY